MSPSPTADLPELALPIHVKVLVDPSSFSVDQMVRGMSEVFQSAGIRVDLASTERLRLPALEDLEVGRCARGAVTPDQAELFAHRNHAGPGEVVVYFVRSTVPPYNGCAAHPEDRPGAVVASRATRWTMAHEVGHVLGLGHAAGANRLMTGAGTGNITAPLPTLAADEIAAMRGSSLVRGS